MSHALTFAQVARFKLTGEFAGLQLYKYNIAFFAVGATLVHYFEPDGYAIGTISNMATPGRTWVTYSKGEEFPHELNLCDYYDNWFFVTRPGE